MDNASVSTTTVGSASRGKVLRTVLAGLQLALFAAALFLLIPAPTSDAAHPYETPVGMAITAFGLSRLTAFFGGKGGVAYNACEVLVFAGFAFVLPLTAAIK